MRILIVDDSKAMRMIIVRTLRQAGFGGHELIEAGSGADGLAAVAKGGLDLVLSDWNMPEMSGIEFLKAVRGAGNKIAFGFVTSEGTPAMRQEANGAGADFLVAKPFTPESFRAALQRFVPAAA